MPAIIKLTDRLTETDVDEEIVVMRIDNGEFFALAGTAAEAWRLIDGRRDRDALVERLADEFAGDEQQIGADIDEFLVRMQKAGLLAVG